MFLSPLFEIGFFLLEESKVLVKDLPFWVCFAEEIDLMLKYFLRESLFISLGLRGFLLVQDKAAIRVVTLIWTM